MSINIDNLTEDELRELNHRIVERLRMCRDLKAHVTMMDFRIGERVCFNTGDHRGVITGTLTKHNRKSVTVIADSGTPWKVSPGFLKKAADGDVIRASAKAEPAQLSLFKG